MTPEEKEENKNRGKNKAKIKAEGCGAILKWNEMEDVTEYVKSQLKEVNDNDTVVIIDIANDTEKLIEEEKYQEALYSIFNEKTKDEEKLKKKKKFLKEILEKNPKLEKFARELSKEKNYDLF